MEKSIVIPEKGFSVHPRFHPMRYFGSCQKAGIDHMFYENEYNLFSGYDLEMTEARLIV